MLDKTSCFSVCYQILLRPLIDWKIVVLRGLSTDFFEQVIHLYDQIQINKKAHVLNKSSKFKKCSFIYFNLASHELSQASQVKTDL